MSLLDQALTETENLQALEHVQPESGIAQEVKRIFPLVVSKKPLKGPNDEPTPHWGLFRSDNRRCLPVAVKQGYEPHTTEDVIALVEAASEAFGEECQVTGTFLDGHFLTVSPSDTHRRSIYGKDDNVFPRLVINAKYGGGAFVGSLGWYRDACSNLAMLRKVGGVHESIRHTSCLPSKINELIETFRACVGGWETTVEYIQRAEEKKVNLANFLKDVYGEAPEKSGIGQTKYNNRIEVILNRVYTERQKTGRPTINPSTWEVSGWEAYNSVQGYTQWDKSRHGRIDNLTRAAKSLEDPHVQKAEELIFTDIVESTAM